MAGASLFATPPSGDNPMLSLKRTLITATLLLATAAANGQNFPTKAVQLTLGFAPGSSIDNLTRMVADKLSKKWGQPVLIDNRPGAGANIAADLVAKSTPDGHTLLVTTSAISISPSLYPKLSYDPLKDLRAVTQLSSMPHILTVSNSLPVNSVSELIAYAKANPGKLNFGSAGTGNSDHMAGELLKAMTKIDMVHVPYKGGQQAMADNVSGVIDVYFPGLPVGLPMVQSKRVKALAVSGTERLKTLSDTPLIADTVKGYQVDLWYGVFAPAGTPDSLVQKIASDIVAVLDDPELKSKFEKMGVTPIGSDPKKFGAFVRSEYDKWRPVIKNGNISVN
jgi:tripartite-type tricarboxylate transporter receptor subunit TctC